MLHFNQSDPFKIVILIIKVLKVPLYLVPKSPPAPNSMNKLTLTSQQQEFNNLFIIDGEALLSLVTETCKIFLVILMLIFMSDNMFKLKTNQHLVLAYVHFKPLFYPWVMYILAVH